MSNISFDGIKCFVTICIKDVFYTLLNETNKPLDVIIHQVCNKWSIDYEYSLIHVFTKINNNNFYLFNYLLEITKNKLYL